MTWRPGMPALSKDGPVEVPANYVSPDAYQLVVSARDHFYEARKAMLKLWLRIIDEVSWLGPPEDLLSEWSIWWLQGAWQRAMYHHALGEACLYKARTGREMPVTVVA